MEIFLKSLLLGILGIIAYLLFQHPTMRVVETAFRFPIVAWGVGLIALIVIPLLFVILAMTIILIPVVLFGFCFVIFGILFGWIDVGYGIEYQLNL